MTPTLPVIHMLTTIPSLPGNAGKCQRVRSDNDFYVRIYTPGHTLVTGCALAPPSLLHRHLDSVISMSFISTRGCNARFCRIAATGTSDKQSIMLRLR